ncbi:hypothetical protein [Nonomuraea fuscirosea]|uniref:hypothetical protein n=1 Tax=Nonomuraea fuscirosea TaxID=1291556 RepID=UPI0033E11E99
MDQMLLLNATMLSSAAADENRTSIRSSNVEVTRESGTCERSGMTERTTSSSRFELSMECAPPLIRRRYTRSAEHPSPEPDNICTLLADA